MANRKILFVFLFIVFLLQWIPFVLYSQDTIITLNKKIIVCKVQDVSNKFIGYNDLRDTTQINTIKTSSVLKIQYSNGTSDVFNHLLLGSLIKDSSESMYKFGRRYGKLNSHFGNIALSSFLITTAGAALLAVKFEGSPEALLVAPVGVLALAAIPPKTNSGISESYPYNDPEFIRGFNKQRRNEKWKAALKGFAFGILVDAAIVIIGSRS